MAKQPLSQVVNVSHPRPVAWDHVFQLINDSLGTHLSIVPYAQWLEKLESLNQDPSPEVLESVVSIIADPSSSRKHILTTRSLPSNCLISSVDCKNKKDPVLRSKLAVFRYSRRRFCGSRVKQRASSCLSVLITPVRGSTTGKLKACFSTSAYCSLSRAC
jgi:hypothetical protein